MIASFCSVATATVAILSTIVGLVMVLMMAGMAQVILGVPTEYFLRHGAEDGHRDHIVADRRIPLPD